MPQLELLKPPAKETTSLTRGSVPIRRRRQLSQRNMASAFTRSIAIILRSIKNPDETNFQAPLSDAVNNRLACARDPSGARSQETGGCSSRSRKGIKRRRSPLRRSPAVGNRLVGSGAEATVQRIFSDWDDWKPPGDQASDAPGPRQFAFQASGSCACSGPTRRSTGSAASYKLTRGHARTGKDSRYCSGSSWASAAAAGHCDGHSTGAD